METQEIVKRLVELVNQGQNIQAEKELYSQDVVSHEQNGHFTTGLEAAMAKTQAAIDGVQEHHSGGVSEAYVGKDSFLLIFDMDMTPKGGERFQAREYGFYKVKDGKIVEEYFFAEPLK